MTTTTTPERDAPFFPGAEPAEAAFRGFARADAPFDEDWLAHQLAARRTRLVSLFFKCFSRTLDARARGLEPLLSGPGPDLERAWPIAMGQVRRALLAPEPHRALVAAAGLALHDAEHGGVGPFSIQLDRPERFVFGRSLLAETTSLDSTSLPAGEPLPFVAHPRRDVLVLPALPFGAPLAEGLVVARPIDAAPAIQKAFELVDRAAPIFAPWIARSVRAIVPIQTTEGKTTSSSFEDLPGVVALSHESPTILLADALVHEASHQHVFFLQQLGPVDDGSDETLYWSPARKQNRPLEKVLLAYHAFVNLLRFWELCRESGAGDPELVERMIAHKRRYCDEMRASLAKTKALTPIGRALAGL